MSSARAVYWSKYGNFVYVLFLCAVLIESIPVFPWLPTTYQQTGWIDRIADLLHKVNGEYFLLN